MDHSMTQPAASASASGVSFASFGGKSNNLPGKIRAACNRCHSQKLRCVRKTEQVNCERCLKLKTTCRYGPRAPRASLRKKPPKNGADSTYTDWHEPVSVSVSVLTPIEHSSAVTADVSDNHWAYTPLTETNIAEGPATMHSDLCYAMQDDSAFQDMCWPNILDNGGSGYLGLTPINESSLSQAGRGASPGISDSYLRIEDQDKIDHLRTSPISAVVRLANLNVELHECAKELPSMAQASANSAAIAGNGIHGAQKARRFAIDRLFRLTTEFIDVMKQLSLVECDTSPIFYSTHPEPPSAQSVLSLVAYSQKSGHACQPATRTGIEPLSRSFSHVDEATMLMVMSCHSRLTEIYASIFQMMQACIEYSLVPQLGNNWAIILPQLQVGGSLSSPPVQVDINTPLSASTSSMYMLMITMLSSQLWEQLTDVMRTGGEVLTGSGSASRYALAAAMWDTVLDRTNRQSENITATKHLLRQYSVVAD